MTSECFLSKDLRFTDRNNEHDICCKYFCTYIDGLVLYMYSGSCKFGGWGVYRNWSHADRPMIIRPTSTSFPESLLHFKITLNYFQVYALNR